MFDLKKTKLSPQAIQIHRDAYWKIVEGMSHVNYSRGFASCLVLYLAIAIYQIDHFNKKQSLR